MRCMLPESDWSGLRSWANESIWGGKNQQSNSLSHEEMQVKGLSLGMEVKGGDKGQKTMNWGGKCKNQ